MTLAIRYKILGREVYILQSEHQNVEKDRYIRSSLLFVLSILISFF
jgi:hypothetical protein